MTFVCYWQCDGCGERRDTDLTPEGWEIEAENDGKDYCKTCKGRRARKREASDG